MLLAETCVSLPCDGVVSQKLPAGEIKDFQVGNYVNKKMARRMDDVIKYTIVAGKKVRSASPGLQTPCMCIAWCVDVW